jgi:prepilin-type N-terminal cleavage/methylation domain-containing protein
MEIILWPCKSDGFSLVELLFALIILSFGLTALVHTHIISARTLKSAQERYNAMLIAQEYIDHALVSKDLSNISDSIFRNNVWYFIRQQRHQTADNQLQVTIEIKWRNAIMTLSTRVF